MAPEKISNHKKIFWIFDREEAPFDITNRINYFHYLQTNDPVFDQTVNVFSSPEFPSTTVTSGGLDERISSIRRFSFKSLKKYLALANMEPLNQIDVDFLRFLWDH